VKINSEVVQKKRDRVRERIVELLRAADEPLETREIELILKNVTRVKVLYRLNNLRGDGVIKGKAVGSGKGCWIWWMK
jgi:predicted Zn-ribbon and HTH transcriptional regulator